MKMHQLFVIMACAIVCPVMAQTTEVLLPQNVAQYWDLGIAAVSPIVVWLVAKYVPVVPKALLPVITPVVGIGLGLGLNALAKTDLAVVDMAKAGALAVFIREVVNQNVTKRLVSDTVTPPTTPPTK